MDLQAGSALVTIDKDKRLVHGVLNESIREVPMLAPIWTKENLNIMMLSFINTE
ncbi:hypothetical protein D3C79_630050 [compost metagenome]